jgi:hypothetical protein
MFDLNTKVQWRTGGRGVFRILKGTVIAVVKGGKLPKTKAMQETLPHGDKPSNRDRYIVEVKDGVFCWANIKTCWKQGEKMPPAKHRFGVKSKPKGKVAKVKVVCPDGYTKDKPTPQVTPEVAPQVAAAAPAPAAESSALPTA